MEWVLAFAIIAGAWALAIAGFCVFVWILSKLFTRSEPNYDEQPLESFSQPFPLPPYRPPPESNSRQDFNRRADRLAHMGAPSPGARQPKWLQMARQEAGPSVSAPAVQQSVFSRRQQAKTQRPVQQRQNVQQPQVVWAFAGTPKPKPAQSARPARATTPATARPTEPWQDEAYLPDADEYPHDTDWDDHDVDWGETR